jgi:hypothetical protein
MNSLRNFALLLTLFLTGDLLHAETPEERAKVVTVTMNITTDIPPEAVARFVEVLSNVKVHYEGNPKDTTTITVSFENAPADSAFRYIAGLAKMDVSYQPDGVHFTPKK